MDEPSQRLPRAAIDYWRYTGALWGLGLVVAGTTISFSMLPWVPLVVALAAAAVLAGVLPPLRWRRWRYEIRDDEIDLVRGALVVRRTLIPIRRVQHVDTESGPLQDSLGLATVTFHTAAGGVSIPALTKTEAEQIRTRVAALARTRDDT